MSRWRHRQAAMFANRIRADHQTDRSGLSSYC